MISETRLFSIFIIWVSKIHQDLKNDSSIIPCTYLEIYIQNCSQNQHCKLYLWHTTISHNSYMYRPKLPNSTFSKQKKKPTFSGNKHTPLWKVSSTYDIKKQKAFSINETKSWLHTNVFTKISFLCKAIWIFLMATVSRIFYSTTAFLKESLFVLLHWQSYIVLNQNEVQFATTIFSY